MPADPAATDLDGLVREMTGWMRRRRGVGLAAPQLGEDRRLVLADPDFGGGAPLVLLNPRIEETFGPARSFEEGCLSFPRVFRHVKRPAGVRVSYTDREGAAREIRDEGLLARVLQHEIDHLDGVLFVDHLASWQRFRVGASLWLRGLYGRGVD
jgi:peptide deformylase